MCRGSSWPELVPGKGARGTCFDGGCAAALEPHASSPLRRLRGAGGFFTCPRRAGYTRHVANTPGLSVDKACRLHQGRNEVAPAWATTTRQFVGTRRVKKPGRPWSSPSTASTVRRPSPRSSARITSRSTLRNAVSSDAVAHAYVFAGSRGTGKTSMAKILAKALDCTGDPATPTRNHRRPRSRPAACATTAAPSPPRRRWT